MKCILICNKCTFINTASSSFVTANLVEERLILSPNLACKDT